MLENKARLEVEKPCKEHPCKLIEDLNEKDFALVFCFSSFLSSFAE